MKNSFLNFVYFINLLKTNVSHKIFSEINLIIIIFFIKMKLLMSPLQLSMAHRSMEYTEIYQLLLGKTS